uniref:Leucine rich repeats and calponin homology domain containing 2 n=2 Tax=Sarcophilus harrisii TaxID=9305 RepID=A0A7N4V3K2_SARHA
MCQAPCRCQQPVSNGDSVLRGSCHRRHLCAHDGKRLAGIQADPGPSRARGGWGCGPGTRNFPCERSWGGGWLGREEPDAFLSRGRRADGARGQQVAGPHAWQRSPALMGRTSDPSSLREERRRPGRGRAAELAAAIGAFLAALRFSPFRSRGAPLPRAPAPALARRAPSECPPAHSCHLPFPPGSPPRSSPATSGPQLARSGSHPRPGTRRRSLCLMGVAGQHSNPFPAGAPTCSGAPSSSPPVPGGRNCPAPLSPAPHGPLPSASLLLRSAPPLAPPARRLPFGACAPPALHTPQPPLGQEYCSGVLSLSLRLSLVLSFFSFSPVRPSVCLFLFSLALSLSFSRSLPTPPTRARTHTGDTRPLAPRNMAASQGSGGGGGGSGSGSGGGGSPAPGPAGSGAGPGAGPGPGPTLFSQPFSGGPQWPPGSLQPPPAAGRSLDRALEEAGTSGILSLSGRKLRDFPGCGYDLTDTTQADLSRNRFTEIPSDVWLFAPLETLNLYHNCIKAIPETIKNLQMLTYLNISRNLLSTLPKYLFDLPLKVLVVSNNKLVSIPEEIGKLKDLMELDISCNEIQVLPQQIGKLHSLRELNIRRNNLHILPDELGDLPLVKLDFSCNKVTEIPVCYRKLRHLQVIILDNNPMQIPPAQICLKGKVHIFKFLNIRACCRIEKKPDSLDLPSLSKRIPSQPLTDSMEDFYPNKNHGPDSGIGSDNGEKRLSTTEPSDDDTISLHSQVSESTRDQTLRNDNHLMGSKVDSHKDQEVYDYIDPNPEDVAVPEQGDVHIGSFVSFLKGREKYSEKSQKNEEWGDEKRIQKEQFLAEEEDGDLKEVTDLRKIAAQLLQQEQKNRLLNHSSSVNPRNRPKQTVEFEKSVLADEVNSALSPFMWQPLGNQKDPVDEQQWPETQPVIWQNEERRRSKQIRKEYFKYKSSRKNSSGNEHEEQDSDNANVSPQSPVSSEDYDRTDSYSHGPFGLKPRSAFSRSSRQEYGTADPGFTMRRKMEHLREEREQIRQLRNNLESRLKVILPDDIGAALMDGVVLCHLANHIRPRSVASIHVPSPAVPKLSMAKCRRNVENFLDACKKLGVSQERLCLPHHILEERGLVKVGVTVQALLELPTTKASQLSAA